MNVRTIRAMAAATMLSMAAGATGCGYLLYPERRGTRSGTIDSGTMVMDLLWLLPGIIPGVVALVVDFSSGAIYVRGRTALRLSPDGRLAVRLPVSPKPARLEFRLVTSTERVIAEKTVSVGPSPPSGPSAANRSVEFEVGASMRRQGNPAEGEDRDAVFLEVRGDHGGWARFQTSIEVARGS